jgi:hypothetical protein
MHETRNLTSFYDMKKHSIVNNGVFFLEFILKSRSDLHLESGGNEFDEELNVYIAGLFNLLFQSDSFLRQKPYISPFDVDVQKWLETHPGLRNTFTVYRDNADFGLLLLGLFNGQKHQGSYHKIVIADQEDKEGRIALYYELAASALSHLQGKKCSLIDVFVALSEHLSETVRILQHMSKQYFDFLEKISEGSFFHLERELNALDICKQYEGKLDEFLKCYTAYKEQPSDEAKKKLLALADDLKKLKPDFNFDGVG